MSFFYGAFAIIASLFISKRFESVDAAPPSIFIRAFIAEFLLIVLIGLVFFQLKLGFFADAEIDNPHLRILAFAGFLALLVGVKTVNRSKVLRDERAQLESHNASVQQQREDNTGKREKAETP